MFLRKKTSFFLLFLILIFIFNKLDSVIRDVVESVKIIKVNSINQQIDNLNKITLTGDVEVFIDNKIHLWADKIEIDKNKQILFAQKISKGAVIIESEDVLILADDFYLNLKDKTGYSNNIRFNMPEGYLFASKAFREDDNNWSMEDVTYTSCDSYVPHWSIQARYANLYKNYLIRIKGMFFKMGPLPFFALPYMVLPLQKKSKSGFLIPKISYDNDLGFGIRQAFYWSIAQRLDSTITIDWRDKKGLALIDEFRWARSNESFTLLNARYALEKNAFVKKSDRISLDTYSHYWIDGKDFRSIDSVYGKNIKTLLRVDFGTDKKIGYQFFDNFLNVDDTFLNSAILRSCGTKEILNIYFDSKQTKKSKFVNLTLQEKNEILWELPEDDRKYIDKSQKEIDEKFSALILPKFEFNSAYDSLFKNFFVKQDIFIDHIFSRNKKQEKFYLNSKVVKENDFLIFNKVDTFRFYYNLNFQEKFSLKDQNFLIFLDSNFQLRSKIKDPDIRAKKYVIEGDFLNGGAYRFFLSGGAQWVMPELFFEFNENYNYYIQPNVNWTFTPKFKQNHWYNSDLWDRIYPKNEIQISLRNNFNVDNLLINLNLYQSIDFYNSSDRFFLTRNPVQKNLFPLCFDVSIDSDVLDLFFKQEYDWNNLQLLTSQIDLSFNLKDFNFYISSVYQHPKLQKARNLFSDIPNFLILSLSVPLVKHTKLAYEGEFYAEQGTVLFPFQGIRPLQHAIKLNYDGHCWGISLGYEEKRYKEYGNWKSDKAFTLFLHLDSLGSFARKFKRPSVINKI
ncbi:hypothetical protein KKE07_04270 [Candidatus Dependentiae bacterium]|nr:hypothetical protein [Candidatus Dependentiae bacterium]